MSLTLFKDRAVSAIATSLGQYLPSGGLFDAAFKEGSVLRSLFVGLSGEYYRANEQLRLLVNEFDPRVTKLFISEWERNVGIPDHCFDGTGDLATRRNHVYIKLALMNCQTTWDYIALAEAVGFSVAITHPIDDYVLPQTVPFLLRSQKVLRNTINISGNDIVANTLPQTVPFIVNKAEEQQLLSCLFNQVKSAQTIIVLQNS
jgi:uncharacterized protein YmfQ (DUF2313 family)